MKKIQVKVKITGRLDGEFLFINKDTYLNIIDEQTGEIGCVIENGKLIHPAGKVYYDYREGRD